MAFNLYYAGGMQTMDVCKYMIDQDCCRLFSFASERRQLEKFKAACGEKKLKIFMDSGAFSVYHNGKVVNIDEYIDFVNNTSDVTVWAQLDVIPFPVLNTESAKNSSEGSWKNYLYAMDRLNDDKRDSFIPVYHFGEPYEALERMLNTEVHGRLAPYIGVGGRHGVSSSAHDKYFEHIFSIVKKSKNPNVKIHAFGMTVFKLLEKYPFYSADSTTWIMHGVNGNIVTRNCGLVTISERQQKLPTHAFHLPKHSYDLLLEEIAERGFTLDELAKDYKKRLCFNVHYLNEWAQNYKYKPSTESRRKRLF